MSNEVRRDVVRLGIDFRTIPVDLGDGIEWEFDSDPSPDKWAALMAAFKTLESVVGSGEGVDLENVSGDDFSKALGEFTKAMSLMLSSEEQQKKWVERGYGLGPQQAISEELINLWTGFPTKQPSPSGEGSKTTG